ncbi:hypothetical protein FJZ28_01760 [Candidatus Peregrinibacteria bacterium]|nr:hypothetical protein [Candidatus Peregrinibacteria bacterium]
MDKQKRIQTLVDKLYFLPWAESQKILQGAMRAPAAALDKLIGVLEDALKKQDAMVAKMIEADPEFPKKLDTFMNQQIHDAAVKVEAGEQAAAQQRFSDFD